VTKSTTSLGAVAIRIRNADMRDPSGRTGTYVYAELIHSHGLDKGRRLWHEALNQLDAYNAGDQTES